MTRGEKELWEGVCITGGLCTLFAIGAAFMGAVMGLASGAHAYFGEEEAYAWTVAVRSFWRAFWFVTPIMFGFMVAYALFEFVRFHLSEHSWRSLVPAFLWPETSKTETTVLTRLGRVMHWVALLPASIAAFIGCVMYWTERVDGRVVYLLGGLAGALAFLLIGRGLRYIFAGE